MITPSVQGPGAPSRRRGARGRVLPLLVLLALLAGASHAAAADWAVGADGGYFDMTNASRSAKAIFGNSSGGASLGGFLRLGLGESFFVAAHGRYFQRQGERVFVAAPGSPVFRLGHPLTIRLVPVYGMFGYRLGHSPRWAPYIALGAGVTSYHEKSDVAGLVETSTATKASGHAAAGVDFLTGPVRKAAASCRPDSSPAARPGPSRRGWPRPRAIARAPSRTGPGTPWCRGTPRSGGARRCRRTSASPRPCR